MEDTASNLVLIILQDLQAKFARFEDWTTSLERRFTSFEHQIDLVNRHLTGVQERLDQLLH